jgi:hypothetical protein
MEKAYIRRILAAIFKNQVFAYETGERDLLEKATQMNSPLRT